MMSKKNDLLKARFLLNMQRVSALMNLVCSESIETLKPTGFAQYEEAGADILRFAVVFLHSTFETLARSLAHQPDKKWSVYSGTDIDKALGQAGIDPKPFKPLYRPLTQLAKRRKRIVHDADFAKSSDTVVEKWDIADYWQLAMWNLAVLVFYYRLLVVTDAANDTEIKKHEQVCRAMTAHVDFGNQLVAFAKTPPESRIAALQRLADTLNTILALLKGGKPE
jgi:hypothetical protein